MEEFAPAQFFAMSDDEKLASPSFEAMDAGFIVGSEAVSLDASQLVAAPVEYDQIVIDTLAADAPLPKPTTPWSEPRRLRRKCGERVESPAQAGSHFAAGRSGTTPGWTC